LIGFTREGENLPWLFTPGGMLRALFREEILMSEQVRASHILLMYAGSDRSSATRSKQDAEQQIATIKGQIDSGSDFAQLAQQHSDCPSGQQGGDLGAFGRGQMVGAFENAAFGLPVGGVSGVIETQFGYHIIKRTA
jgi:parvulin-like peptidyl-prolyl isomerase